MTPLKTPHTGFGATDGTFTVYCANTPSTTALDPHKITPICYQDIEQINSDNGNGWRKIFNVYAKILFEINSMTFKDWQSLRNEYLLQTHCAHSLILNPIDITKTQNVQLIMGKGFALSFFDEPDIQWITPKIAHVKLADYPNTFITPYFDYRQFNNADITEFANIIKNIAKF
ncbi:DUF6942 family protein [Marinicellulosiphila megalodicopiae]|uniref:DUF6942 family protein n=1 Tax=Marinicellulosiphila megalodicopiae TaxID=2724896 RepID=UPI003BB0123E